MFRHKKVSDEAFENTNTATPQSPYRQVQHTYTDTNTATLDVIRPEHFGMEGAGLPSNESVEAPNIVNVAKVAACAVRFC